MKRIWVVASAVVVAVSIGLVWLLWRPSGVGEAKESAVEPVVAVRLGEIREMTLRAWVTAFGMVEPEPAGTRPAAGARVTAAVPGVVTAVSCAEGQEVARGALLFQLDSRLADVAVERAQQAVELATTTLARQQQLILVEGTSQQRLEEATSALATAESELAAAQLQQALLRVVSPLAGTLTRVNVRVGEAVEPATTLAEIVDLDRLVVNASVPVAELAALHRGDTAEVVVSAADTPLQGEVSVISPQVDPATGTAPVRVSLPAGNGLLPGQVVSLRIVSAEHEGCLAAPVPSVVTAEDGTSVVALVHEGIAQQTQVTTGLQEGDWIEVAGAGLAAGAPVVTEGAYGLPGQTRIRVLGQ